MIRGASFSPCRRYRYELWRFWGEAPTRFVQFIGLNPSTADETADDPTVRRCIGYARDWGYNGLVMTNIFAFRATDPKVMKAQTDPVGPDNDIALCNISNSAAMVVAAWGTHGTWRHRGIQVRRMIPSARVLRLTKDGSPAHPLYLPKHLTPVEWV